MPENMIYNNLFNYSFTFSCLFKIKQVYIFEMIKKITMVKTSFFFTQTHYEKNVPNEAGTFQN